MASIPPCRLSEGVLGTLPLLDLFPHSLHQSIGKSFDLIEVQAPDRRDSAARAHLSGGILCMAQGDVKVAVGLLEEAADESRGWLPEVEIQALVYAMHCRTLQFRWSPQGCTIVAKEVTSRFNFEQEYPPMMARIATLKHIVNNNAIAWTKDLLELQRLLVIARPSRPSSACLWQSRDIFIPQVLQTIEFVTTHSLDVQTKAGFFIELAWLYRGVGNLAEFHRLMESLRVWMQPGSGTAHCEMRLGDHHATTYGAPETWDMCLEQGTSSNAPPSDDELEHFTGYRSLETEAALGHYQNAQRMFKELGITRGVATVQLRLGYLETLPGGVDDFRRALDYVVEARDLYQSCGDAAGAQLALAHICLCRVGLGQLPEDVAAARSIGVWGHERGSFSYAFGLGLLFAKLARRWLVAFGDYERSLAVHRLAEALFGGLDAKLSMAYSITDQMDVYEMLGDSDSLVITAERAFEVCEELAIQPGFAHANQALNHGVQALRSLFFCAQKDTDPELMEDVATRLTTLKSKFLESIDGAGISSLEEMMSQVMAMEREFQELMASTSSAQSTTGTDDGLLAETITKARSLPLDPDAFLKQAAVKIIDNIISTAATQIPMYRGRQAFREGDQEEANRQWALARTAIDEQPNDMRQILLTALCVERKQIDKAAAHVRAYYTERIAVHNALPVAAGQDIQSSRDTRLWQWENQVLDMFTRIGHFDEASQLVRTLEERWGNGWWQRGGSKIWEKLSIVAQVEEGCGRYEAACLLYEQAMKAFEQRRSQLSMDEYKLAMASDSLVQEIYFCAARTAVKWYHQRRSNNSTWTPSALVDFAFNSLERGKARGLLDLLAGSTERVGQDASERGAQWFMYKRLLAREATQRTLLAQAYNSKDPVRPLEVAKLKQKIVEYEAQRRDLEEQLTQGAEHTRLQGSIAQVIDIQSLSRLLKKGAAVLQYAYRQQDLIAWMVSSRGTVHVHRVKVPEVELEIHVRRFHRGCDELMDDTGEHTRWLAENLLLPFASHLMEHSRLIFVPYRILHMLPFHALPITDEPLVCTHSVSYLPSASMLHYLHSGSEKRVESILAVGNPSQTSGAQGGLQGDLPYSEVEAKLIARLMPTSEVLCASSATKQAVEEAINRHSALHFATHGVLAADVPMRSAIHLADGEQITVDELMGRNLKAHLVVLSACNTGRGRVTNGEDVIGFARALLAAGVSHVLVSLWPVDDKATCYLMEQFYTHVKEGYTMADALRAAQLALRRITREDLDARLVGLRMDLGPGASADDRNRGNVTTLTRRGGIAPASRRRPTMDYMHPNFWAPFVLISAGIQGAKPRQAGFKDLLSPGAKGSPE